MRDRLDDFWHIVVIYLLTALHRFSFLAFTCEAIPNNSWQTSSSNIPSAFYREPYPATTLPAGKCPQGLAPSSSPDSIREWID